MEPGGPREVLGLLNANYPIRFDRVEFLRDAGSLTYAAFAGAEKYFVRRVSPAGADAARAALKIQAYLQSRGFPVIPIVSASGGAPCARIEGGGLVGLHPFIAGEEAAPERYAEAAGALIGRLHAEMRDYPGALEARDRAHFIDKYLGQMRALGYPRAGKFVELGDVLWARVENLPRGFCHGDLYCGNLHRAADGKLYLLDFDAAHRGFPMYDLALYCNRTDYFKFCKSGLQKSRNALARCAAEYVKYSPITDAELDAFPALLGVYHFALQAAVIERVGLEKFSDAFFDAQLDWLTRWRDQCGL